MILANKMVPTSFVFVFVVLDENSCIKLVKKRWSVFLNSLIILIKKCLNRDFAVLARATFRFCRDFLVCSGCGERWFMFGHLMNPLWDHFDLLRQHNAGHIEAFISMHPNLSSIHIYFSFHCLLDCLQIFCLSFCCLLYTISQKR